MKVVVFGAGRRVGALIGDRVVDFGTAGLPSELDAFIEGGAGVLSAAAGVLAEVESGTSKATVHRLADVELRAPHVRGSRLACAGGNFADHTLAMAQKTGLDPLLEKLDLPQVAAAVRERGIWGFWKVGRDATDPNGSVKYPEHAGRLDYEAEIAVVLAREAEDQTAGDLAANVWGVTIFADWSIRDFKEAPAPLKFGTVKNFNGSYSIGPCIVVNEGLDPSNLDIETYVNGELRQRFNTRDMVFSYGDYYAYLSRDFAFYPGDIISGGTAAGTAADSSTYTNGVAAPERFLKPGDTVEMVCPAIGTLTAHIVKKER